VGDKNIDISFVFFDYLVTQMRNEVEMLAKIFLSLRQCQDPESFDFDQFKLQKMTNFFQLLPLVFNFFLIVLVVFVILIKDVLMVARDDNLVYTLKSMKKFSEILKFMG
jgi:hypothetical protein